MNAALRLAEIMAARLCHDLSGPVGTLAGVLDGAGDDPEALQLAEETAGLLASRLRLLRAAWAADAPGLSVAELRSLAPGLPNRRAAVDFSRLAEGADFEPGSARVVTNVLLLAGECLRSGGTVTLTGAADGDLAVVLSGPNAAWPAGFAAMLVDEAACWAALTDARTMQAPLTALLARAAGIRLSLLLGSPGPPPLLMALGG